MLDIAPTEMMVVVLVAILIIGPKDLPKAMRFVGQWIGRARSVARQFRQGFDSIVQEAELADMEKKWNEENARIMREHPAKALDGSDKDPGKDKAVAETPDDTGKAVVGDAETGTGDSGEPASAPNTPKSSPASAENAEPVMVEKPQIRDEADAPAESPRKNVEAGPDGERNDPPA